tara:strand:- start:348 stop:1001 length:654 start_codon:yes stop_codon:yes gene_type:complete
MPIYIFDLDLTLTKKDTYVPFLLQCLKKKKRAVFYFPFLIFSVFQFIFKKIDNSELKQRFLSAFLSGVSLNEIQPIIDSFSQKILMDGLFVDAIKELEMLLKNGNTVILASASLDIYVNKIGRLLNFSKIISTRVEIDSHNKITGKISGVNLRGVKKLQIIKNYLRETSGKNITFYSDSISDLPLFEWVEYPIIINYNTKYHYKLKDLKKLDFRYWS